MKHILQLFALAACMALAVAICAPTVRAQQTSPDPSSKTDPSVPQAQQQNETHMPASGEATTRDPKVFTGRVVKEEGQIVLKDLVTKVSYKLDDTSKAKAYLGKEVKATGKLDINTNTIQVERIEPLS